ncbi:NBS-LRR type resistance protein [Cucumis melo var. makuwa]|uniref:NBS-LRR type resistance protein n=1 Tax=Cucumis melo var. makuwa TaxID=1194695 RepID=A0A5D3E3I2_CUCMM|nr:NBS-LRR type resistance protein [Cucumis melo var. makuwa]TYK30349.1 NBS-LRR type resistance protein [Cucumis melo var. makuwa]
MFSGSVERTHQSRNPEGCTYQSSDLEGYTYQSSDPEGCTYQSSDPEGCTYQSSDPEGYTYQSSDPEGYTYQSSDPEGYTYHSKNLAHTRTASLGCARGRTKTHTAMADENSHGDGGDYLRFSQNLLGCTRRHTEDGTPLAVETEMVGRSIWGLSAPDGRSICTKRHTEDGTPLRFSRNLLGCRRAR